MLKSLFLVAITATLTSLGAVAYSSNSTPIPPPATPTSCTQAELDLNVNNMYAANIAYVEMLEGYVTSTSSRARSGSFPEDYMDEMMNKMRSTRSSEFLNLIDAHWNIADCFEPAQ